MKPLAHSVVALLLASVLGPALAQAPASTNDHDSHHPVTAPAVQDNTGSMSADQGDLSDGEIKNLGMPPMTMVFRVTDASMLAPFKPGDKVRFRVEQRTGAYIVTRMEAAR